MRINELKINSYGKLKDKNIELKDGINIIYGENEKGKSTLLNFIVNSFYGTSRNKKGRAMSDYDRYKPWEAHEFSGKIVYTLDDNKRYEVFREFSKKNPKIYDENMEEISKNYSIDKTAGSQFFFEQTKVDEQAFVSSVVSYQNEVELSGQTQNILLQKMANSSSTGDDSISYKKAMDKLNKKQLDEIGTSRSQGKPINLVINELESISSRNEYLKKYENYKYEIEDKKNDLDEEIEKLNLKYDFLQKLDNVKQHEKIEKEKLKFGENKIDELEREIQELSNQKNQVENEKNEVKNYEEEPIKLLPYLLSTIALFVVAIIIFFIVKKVLIAIVPAIVAVVIAIVGIFKNKKIKDKNEMQKKSNLMLINKNKEVERKTYEINAKLELLEKSQKEEIDNFEKLKNDLLNEISLKKDDLKAEYYGKFDISEINKLINIQDVLTELNHTQQLINEKNLELHRLNLDKENILPKLEELAENEEKIASNQELYEELKEKNNAINIAKEVLEQAYQKMKSDVTPKFTQNLSKNVSKITNEKYNKIILNEEDGILVELPNGSYKNANTLSLGTIEQLYLSFRLSVIENLSDESMPIILDEVFAFFDDNRLKETLKNFGESFSKKHQIILLTCTDREERILNEIGYKYNKVNL